MAAKQLDLAPAEEEARLTFVTVMRLLDITDQDMAGRLGVSRQSIQQRRKGQTRIRIGDLASFAAAVNIPLAVLQRGASDTAAWLFTNRLEQVIAHSRCSAPKAAATSAAA